MNAHEERDHMSREIARGLRDALAGALGPNPAPMAWEAARDVAQLLGLPGLDQALAACEPHATPPRPVEVEHLRSRLHRLAIASAQTGGLAPFFSADRELQSLGDKVATLQWASSGTPYAAPGAASPVLTLAAVDALAELVPAAALPALQVTRMSAPAAAALRAACDWLGLDAHRVASLTVSEGSLALSCHPAHLGGLGAAADVLGSVDGHVAPGPIGTWMLRAPVITENPTFLMVEQGHLPLALPWHSIVRLRMLSGADSPPADAPVLPSLTSASRPASERPAALIAHGRQRAWLLADRLVWRLAARPDDAEVSPPLPGLTRTVRADDGTVYWVVEPAWLLRGVTPLPFPEGEAPAIAPPASPPPAEAAPVALTSAHVTPLPASGQASEGLPATAPDAPEPAAPAAIDWLSRFAASEPPRTALVAEDSFVARVFLQRLLEQHGFEVTTVETAADLRRQLAAADWRFVFADVHLPDAGGRAHLREILEARTLGAAGFRLVALTRDEEDEVAARDAGADRRLRKPFEADEIAALLESEGLTTNEADA